MADISFEREILTALGGTAVGALLYTVGSAYLGGYYQYFDISLNELDLSLHQILYYALFGLYSSLLASAPLVISVLVLWKLALDESFPLKRTSLNPHLIATFLSLAALFIIVYLVIQAKDAGISKAAADLPNIKKTYVKVYNNESAAKLIRSFELSDSEVWETHHLISTKDITFIVVTAPNNSTRHTIKIPLNKSTIVSIQRGN
ncbi:hypothetical protein [Defluviimonas sp. SAOS-178_SWC]|uniref:hypothetical protein n=1 Tax=Defluviimonas sp. SAOS-178_SWC TaxID=3121287 RepID=UPI003221FEA2